MRIVVFKDRFSQKKIGLKKGLELIYQLEFNGFVQIERMWWWKNFIEFISHIEIIYPKQGFLSIVRMNGSYVNPNTIRVVTRKTNNSDKRELFVLQKLFGKEETKYANYKAKRSTFLQGNRQQNKESKGVITNDSNASS